MCSGRMCTRCLLSQHPAGPPGRSSVSCILAGLHTQRHNTLKLALSGEHSLYPRISTPAEEVWLVQLIRSKGSAFDLPSGVRSLRWGALEQVHCNRTSSLSAQDWKTFQVVHLYQFDVGGLPGELSLYGFHVGGTRDRRVPVVVMAEHDPPGT